MSLRVFVAIGFTIAAAAAIGAAAPPLGADSAVRFSTVARDDGAASAVKRRTAFVIRSKRRWHHVWSRLHDGVRPRPRPPRIAFSRHMLLVATSGERPSGGHSIAFRRVTARSGSWRARLREVAPGEGCVATAIITAPFHVVRVRRSDARVSFVRTRDTVAC